MSKIHTVIGWREWVGLPSLGIAHIRAKIDTGARTSALHAFDITETHRGRKATVHFKISPLPGQPGRVMVVEAPLLDKRIVKDSHGRKSLRPVIPVDIELAGLRWKIEVTLVDRTDMNFRMLLGRQALRSRFLINPGKSYLLGR
jgi:hypothetical protein